MSIHKNNNSIYGNAVASLSQLEDKYSFNRFEVVVPDIGLSDESKSFLATYNDIFRRNFKSRIALNTSLYPKDELDYSPLVNQLAKIIELELNLSIVQWMRSQEGIKMPQYYNKYKACNREYIWQGNTNFNQENKDGSLRGVSIGNAYYYAKNSLRNGKFPQEITNPKGFLALWSKVGKIRNDASHTSVLSFSDFEKMSTIFFILLSENYLVELMMLKESIQKP